MKTSVVDWQPFIPQGFDREELFKTFKEKAEAVQAKVIRAGTVEDAEKYIVQEMVEAGVKNSAIVPMDLVNIQNIKERAEKEGINVFSELDRDLIEKADFGISQFDLGIAELGTIVQDADSIHKRLVSMLPAIHLAVISTQAIVRTFADSLEVIDKTYKGNPSNFIAFITGPSRTADIERVLTIGVHGPARLIVLCVD